MMKKSLTIGLILMGVGLGVRGYVIGIQKSEHQRAMRYKDKHTLQMESVLDEYNQWLNTPQKERAALPWGFDKTGKKLKDAQLKKEQDERLIADLERLAAGEQHIFPFADQLYGKDWRQKLKVYKQKKELREIASVASVVCASIGGAIAGICSVAGFIQLALNKLSGIFEKVTASYNRSFKRKEVKNEWQSKINEQEQLSENGQSKKQKKILKNRVKTLSDSGWQPLTSVTRVQFESDGDRNLEPVPVEAEDELQNESFVGNENERESENTEDESIPECEKELEEEQESYEQLCESSYQIENDFTPLKDVDNNTFTVGQAALAVKEGVLEKPNEIRDTLKHLTQQVSAIRQYASNQQAKVKNLQAGYDWKIIKNFCLRIIRSIDNIEIRIEQLQQEGIDTTYLQEVRDELLFSLESSGVEQFRPHLKSEYRGLEKTTEVIKEREPAKKAKYKGHIAKIIRPGYQYCLNEDKVKVVRTAQVKLYG